MENGKKSWYIVDGYLPYAGPVKDAGFKGHEAVMILNCNPTPAHLLLDIYFEDRAPVKDIALVVEGERVKCLRMDKPADIGGVELGPQVQYSLRLRSDLNVVVQYGRMDIAQPNLAYIGMMGYHE